MVHHFQMAATHRGQYTKTSWKLWQIYGVACNVVDTGFDRAFAFQAHVGNFFGAFFTEHHVHQHATSIFVGATKENSIITTVYLLELSDVAHLSVYGIELEIYCTWSNERDETGLQISSYFK